MKWFEKSGDPTQHPLLLNYPWLHYYLLKQSFLSSAANVFIDVGLYGTFIHYSDVIMGSIASQIRSLTLIYSTVYSDADQWKHQSSASLAFARGIHRGPVISPQKWPVTRKIFPFDDVITRYSLPVMFCLFFHFYYFTLLIYMYSKGILRLLSNLLIGRVSRPNSGINCATICLTTNVYFGSVFMMINTNMHIWSRAGHSTLLSFAFVFVLCMYKSAADSISKCTV